MNYDLRDELNRLIQEFSNLPSGEVRDTAEKAAWQLYYRISDELTSARETLQRLEDEAWEAANRRRQQPGGHDHRDNCPTASNKLRPSGHDYCLYEEEKQKDWYWGCAKRVVTEHEQWIEGFFNAQSELYLKKRREQRGE